MSDAASLRKNLQCSICLDLYLDPLSLICGHSYCQKCIHEHWDNEELQQIPFTCPDCRSSFTARPEPCKNVSLSMVVEVLREQKQRSFSTPEEGSHNVSNALCQRHNEELIYYCRTENRCTCGTCMLRSCRTHDVERIKIQSKQEKVKLANNLLANDCQQKSIEEQIEEWTLKTQDSKGLPLLVPVACAPVSPNIRQCGTLQMDAVNRVLPEITRLLQDELPNALHPEILQEENKETSRTSSGFLTNSTSGAAETSRTSRKLKAEPCRAPANMSECRVRFYKDYRNLTFDPETAHKYIQLSHQDCRASHRTRPQKNSVPESSKRFQSWQVMCTEGFSEGSHYWELELSTFFVELGVAYGSLKRTPEIENLIGRNSYSWSLQVRSMMMHHSVWHNNKESKLHAPQYKKIGVHLNCTAGSLTFYGIREGSLECLHSFSCLFSEKVYPVFWIGEDASVTLQHNQDSPMDDVL
ncbi:E3 ubiquitin-protein ligase TRIM65 isoform X2 [Pseudophryne corroboree]|uniref:E3 ubiquitin-protein ligase TRIM65 isoform X2 n=1 Tax=Pseudophryne corroboree TaxID=495146 RepID=UPI003081FF3A